MDPLAQVYYPMLETSYVFSPTFNTSGADSEVTIGVIGLRGCDQKLVLHHTHDNDGIAEPDHIL